jgi:hypothetical protein
VVVTGDTCWSIYTAYGYGYSTPTAFVDANPSCITGISVGQSLCLTPVLFPKCLEHKGALEGLGCYDQWDSMADKDSFPDTATFNEFNVACQTNSVQPGQQLCVVIDN